MKEQLINETNIDIFIYNLQNRMEKGYRILNKMGDYHATDKNVQARQDNAINLFRKIALEKATLIETKRCFL